jgi:hypothetical protein
MAARSRPGSPCRAAWLQVDRLDSPRRLGRPHLALFAALLAARAAGRRVGPVTARPLASFTTAGGRPLVVCGPHLHRSGWENKARKISGTSCTDECGCSALFSQARDQIHGKNTGGYGGVPYIGHFILYRETENEKTLGMATMDTISLKDKEITHFLLIPTMATMATTNAAATSLDSIWTPRSHFHTAWSRTRVWVSV